MKYWLIKSEPNTYSILDLQREKQTIWDSIRNYQARNFLKQMQPGDVAFFYHSNTTPPGIVGLMKVIEPNVIDPVQFDTNSRYYDPKSKPESPRWHTVKVEFLQAFNQMIPLETLKQHFSDDELWVVRRGNRLSVLPVAEDVAQRILKMVAD